MTNVDPANIEKAALLLRRAHDDATPCPPIRDLISEGGVDAAYAAQNLNTEFWLSKGRLVKRG